MKNRTTKILDLADKIINSETPRFLNGRDLLADCLSELRHAAVMGLINHEEYKLINATVTIADKLEDKVYDKQLYAVHQGYTEELLYVPMCVCESLSATLNANFTCEACHVCKDCETEKEVA